MIQIVFVDDEARILDGIRRSMYCMRDQWEMRFASSGADALKQLESKPADVVISDMRMPGMDGVELLSEIKRLHPEVVRFVLSGQAEAESVMRVTRSAHRYISKPCDSTTLKVAIARAMDLRALLNSNHLAAIVGSVDALPSPPKRYNELLDCLRNPEATISDIVQILRHDVEGRTPDTTRMGRSRVVTRRLPEWAEIHISDDGCGMPRHVQNRIFDPFFTTKAAGKGTGQGLPIAHNVIVKKHRGLTQVNSEPGRGTTFTIRVPLEISERAENAA